MIPQNFASYFGASRVGREKFLEHELMEPRKGGSFCFHVAQSEIRRIRSLKFDSCVILVVCGTDVPPKMRRIIVDLEIMSPYDSNVT